LSNLIREFKYSKNADLASPFAWLLADYIRCRTEILRSVDVMVPSPSNPNKQYERGFAPCLLIVKELSRCLAIPYVELFAIQPLNHRFREIPYAEGRELIKYKSRQYHGIVSERNILLLDDVATTGRTLGLLADVLSEGGAGNICAITIAKTGAPED